MSIFNEETDKLVRILKENVDEPVNVVPLISQCTLGAIVGKHKDLVIEICFDNTDILFYLILQEHFFRLISNSVEYLKPLFPL